MVTTCEKPFAALCAGDLMSKQVVMIPKEMSVQGAARLLSRAQVTGAPVVDLEGRCVGVISSTDFVHWVEGKPARHAGATVEESMCSAWQILEDTDSPAACVQNVMTKDLVTAPPSAKVSALAQMMLDAHIHRVIVVDDSDHPIGIVSATDILAAVARSGHHPE